MTTVTYTPTNITNPIRTGPANPCGTNTCGAENIGIKCYNPYSSSQSFFLRMKTQTRTARNCENYSPDCQNGGCSSEGVSCTKRTGKRRIVPYRNPGVSASPYRGGGSAKELIRRVKHRMPATVRGRQTSQSALIRASRPVQRLPASTLGRPNTYGTGVMLARTQRRPVAWNPPRKRACCTDTEANPQPPSDTINQVRGVPQNNIGPGNPCKGPCTCGACGTCETGDSD